MHPQSVREALEAARLMGHKERTDADDGTD
jgi:hypothetical protein